MHGPINIRLRYKISIDGFFFTENVERYRQMKY